MRPAVIVLTGSYPPPLEAALQSRFGGEPAVRILHAPTPRAEEGCPWPGELIASLKQAYLEIEGNWEGWRFERAQARKDLEREVLFFFVTDLADLGQANSFLQILQTLGEEFSTTSRLPISIGGWFLIPRSLDDKSRTSVFYESLGKFQRCVTASTNLRWRPLILKNPFPGSSPVANLQMEEEAAFLFDSICNDAVSVEMDSLHETGWQRSPNGKESLFSITKSIRLGYDREKVAGYLRDRLIQLLIEHQLLADSSPSDDEVQNWFDRYLGLISGIVPEALSAAQHLGGIPAVDRPQTDGAQFSWELDEELRSIGKVTSSLSKLVTFRSEIFELFGLEIEKTQSLMGGLRFLDFLRHFRRGPSGDTMEGEVNLSKLRGFVIEKLVTDGDLIEKCLHDLLAANPEQNVPDPWMHHFSQAFESLRCCIADSRLAGSPDSAGLREPLLVLQAKLSAALLESLAQWPCQPRIAQAALKEFVHELDALHEPLKQQKELLESRLKEHLAELQSLEARGLVWKVIHSGQFREAKNRLEESIRNAREPLVGVGQQIAELKDGILVPWVAFGIRWLIVLQSLAQTSAVVQSLYHEQERNCRLLEECAISARTACEEIAWLVTPPHIDLVSRADCERILEEEGNLRELYDTFLKSLKEAKHNTDSVTAEETKLSEFADGKIHLLVEKLRHFASTRVERFQHMDLEQIVATLGDAGIQLLLENSLNSLEPWMILDASLARALGEKAPISVCLTGVTRINQGLVSRLISWLADRICFYDTEDPSEIRLLHFTCGVPAFLLARIVDCRKAWLEINREDATGVSQSPVDDLLPDSML